MLTKILQYHKGFVEFMEQFSDFLIKKSFNFEMYLLYFLKGGCIFFGIQSARNRRFGPITNSFYLWKFVSAVHPQDAHISCFKHIRVLAYSYLQTKILPPGISNACFRLLNRNSSHSVLRLQPFLYLFSTLFTPTTRVRL